MQRPEFPIFNTQQFQKNALVLFKQKKEPEQTLDELLKKTPFLQTTWPNLMSEPIDDTLWKKIQEEALELKTTGPKWSSSSPENEERPKMITPISFFPPSAEEKLTMNEPVVDDFTTPLNSFNTIAKKLTKNVTEGEEDLQNIREKRKIKPSESLKSPYFQRVVVMKNKVQDIEKKLADTIFAARGNLE